MIRKRSTINKTLCETLFSSISKRFYVAISTLSVVNELQHTHKDYNTLITTPHDGTFEHLWRQDQIYDIMVVIDYNVDPVIPYRGSAIFLHLTSRKNLPTEGCVALKTEAMLEILSKAEPGAVIEISENL